MQIIHLCPANLATGGTESIHNLVKHLNECGADAKILYVGKDLSNPQPVEYISYGCPYITEFPENYKGVIIFPEVWGNQSIEDKYKDCITAIHWQGVDVYDWNTPVANRGLFLQRKDTIHFTNLEYGMEHLRKLGIEPIKVSDVLNEDFFNVLAFGKERKDTILYNPVSVKMTKFQVTVMSRCANELGLRFKPLEGYTRDQLINLFRQSKLYIDFGVFSGRERLPREAVMCGCCILTSNKGAARYYLDNPIKDDYKIEDVDEAMRMIKYILDNYYECTYDFDWYRKELIHDKEKYPNEVRELYNAFLSHSSNL